MHTALNTSALENSIEPICQTLHRLDGITGLQSIPLLTSNLQSLHTANSGASRQAESVCCPALLSGKVELALFNVDGNDSGASARSGEGTGEKTNGTGTDDKDSGTRAELSSSVGVEDDGEGFGKSSEGEFKVWGEPREREGSRQFLMFLMDFSRAGVSGEMGSRACLFGTKWNSLVNQFSRPGHDLSQCPVQMRVGLCRARESHVRTKVVPAPSAHLTGLAVNTNFHGDLVTNFEVETRVNIRTNSSDDTTGFVTEDEGFSNLKSTVRTVEVVMDCGIVSCAASFWIFPH